jgi:hypothetical protein
MGSLKEQVFCKEKNTFCYQSRICTMCASAGIVEPALAMISIITSQDRVVFVLVR